MNLVLTLHDPEASMREQTERVMSKWKDLFPLTMIAYTMQTDSAFREYLLNNGMQMIEGGLWGEARTKALRYLVEQQKPEPVLIMDFDKLIHILEFYPDAFRQFIGQSWINNTLIGRSQKAWDTFPKSWKETETIANKLGNRFFQTDQRDFLLGTFVLVPEGQQAVVRQSTLKGFDSLFESVKILGEGLDYQESDIFDWEDPDRNQADIDKLGRDDWERVRFDGLEEWKKRIRNLLQIVEVL